MRNFLSHIVLSVAMIASAGAVSAGPVSNTLYPTPTSTTQVKHALQPQDYQAMLGNRTANLGTDKLFRSQVTTAPANPSDDTRLNTYAALAGLCMMAVIARRRSRNS